MRIALSDLDLKKIFVIYPGERRYTLADKVEAIPFGEILAKDSIWASGKKPH